MSKFFKALEQADRDRVRQGAAPDEPTATETFVMPEAPPRAAVAPAPPPPVAPPRAPRPAATPERARRRAAPVEARRPKGAPEGLQIDEHLVSLLDPTGFGAEQYRALRHLMEHLRKAAELGVVAISSPGDGDGKTTTAINLAGALAQSPDARVLLIDADLRRSSMLGRLGLPDDAPGVVDLVQDRQLRFEDVVRPLPGLNFSILPAGRRTDTPYEVLKSAVVADLLAEARRRYDHVIVDTAPVVPVPDCRILEKLVDGMILVVGANRTPRRMVEEALSLLDAAKLVGLIFNKDARTPSSYYAAYGLGVSRNGHGGWWARARHAVRVGRRRAR
jgi:protein-tyrosine kinase